MDEILYIGLSQSFFAGLLIATKKPRNLANQVLAAWFFLICIEMIIILINSNLIELYSIKVLPFTYGPLMLLYAKIMTQEHKTFELRYLLHFLPFLVFLGISLVYLNKPVMEGTKGFLLVDSFISLRLFYGFSFFFSITAYSIATFRVIIKHQQHLKSLLSFSSAKYTLQWLIGLSLTFYITYVIMFMFGLMDILLNFMPFDPYEISFIGLTIFAFLYGFYGFNQPDIFYEIVGKEEETDNLEPEPEGTSYRKSGLKPKLADEYLKKLVTYMEKEKPYLERELSITQVSEHLNIPRHHLTEVINTALGKNFYQFVNEFRITEVKNRLKDPKMNNLTILAIAYDSGFNSKSAFNTIFKEMTGMTPSQYLKSADLDSTT